MQRVRPDPLFYVGMLTTMPLLTLICAGVVVSTRDPSEPVWWLLVASTLCCGWLLARTPIVGVELAKDSMRIRNSFRTRVVSRSSVVAVGVRESPLLFPRWELVLRLADEETVGLPFLQSRFRISQRIRNNWATIEAWADFPDRDVAA